MTAFFDYPKSAAFDRVVPKNKIYEHAGATAALKGLFVREVDQIVWRFKLAPETINLSATKSVTEIQVFSISLKTGKVDEDVLRAIDKVIPFPLIFELTYDRKCKVTAAFKRPSAADNAKWVISAYFASDWVPNDAPRMQLPVALNLGALYDKVLTALMPKELQKITGKAEGDLEARVIRMETIRAKTFEVERIKARLMRERQFNKRVAINAELRNAKLELKRLAGVTAQSAHSSE